MKARKRFGTALFGLGCAAAFVGLTSLLANATDNPQLQLVLQAFYTDTPQPAVSLFNTGIVFCLTHAWQVLTVGGAAMLLGGILLLRTSVKSPLTHSKATYQKPAEPSGTLPFKPFPPSQDNPFAVAVWDEEAPSAPVNTFAPAISQTKHSENAAAYWYKPLLEENRVDAAGMPSPFAQPKQNTEVPVSSSKLEQEIFSSSLRSTSSARRRAHHHTRST